MNPEIKFDFQTSKDFTLITIKGETCYIDRNDWSRCCKELGMSTLISFQTRFKEIADWFIKNTDDNYKTIKA